MTIRFVPQLDSKSSIKQRELERAAQRSHAAKLYHKRRKALDRSQPGHGAPARPLQASALNYSAEPRPERRSSAGAGGGEHGKTDNAPHPATILLKGNSDPFASFVIDIDPVFNRMVVFARESFFPSVAVPRWLRKQHSKTLSTTAFEFGLSSGDTAATHIIAYGACLARVLPYHSGRDVENVCVKVQTRSLERTRMVISQGSRGQPPPLTTIQQIVYMFQGAGEFRDWESAKVHANMLRHLLVTMSYNSSSIFLFLTSMHTILELATFTFTTAVLNFDDWQVEQWKPLWTYAESSIRLGVSQDESPSMAHPLLRDCLLRLRKWLMMTKLVQLHGPAPEKAQADVMNLWGHTRPVQDCIDLLGFYVSSTASASNECNIHSLLALTLFCCIRSYVHFAPLDDTDTDLRDASHVLAPRLRLATQIFENDASYSVRQQYAQELLWVYFTGAIFEQRVCLYQWQVRKLGTDDGWFSGRLARQANTLAVVKWPEAKLLLQKFAYSDLLEPAPAVWWTSIFDLKPN